MNLDFLKCFLSKTGFPDEARSALLDGALRLTEQTAQTGGADTLAAAVQLFYENSLDMELVRPCIQAAAEQSGVHPYMLWLLFLIEAAAPVRQAYTQKGIREELFWDTFTDLRYKAEECRAMYGIWGNFVSSWYPIFYSCDIIKLGRLEYENAVYPLDIPYEKHGIALQKGTPVKSIHIPSSKEPFDASARLASYRLAYEFFQEELRGGPLVCMCHSWLLYPQNRQILGSASHVVDFMDDFDLIRAEADPAFSNSWRIFGPDCTRPAKDLPERTSMQRAFKSWLCAGKETGYGLGILIFDGENILRP